MGARKRLGRWVGTRLANQSRVPCLYGRKGDGERESAQKRRKGGVGSHLNQSECKAGPRTPRPPMGGAHGWVERKRAGDRGGGSHRPPGWVLGWAAEETSGDRRGGGGGRVRCGLGWGRGSTIGPPRTAHPGVHRASRWVGWAGPAGASARCDAGLGGKGRGSGRRSRRWETLTSRRLQPGLRKRLREEPEPEVLPTRRGKGGAWVSGGAWAQPAR